MIEENLRKDYLQYSSYDLKLHRPFTIFKYQHSSAIQYSKEKISGLIDKASVS